MTYRVILKNARMGGSACSVVADRLQPVKPLVQLGLLRIHGMRVLLFMWVFCAALGLDAQVRNFNWVFASGTWIQFSADTMISVPMADTVSLRNACISDTSGHFVLLADDLGIRNALFSHVQGGTAAELGWNVPAANYLVLPLPGAPARYAVFINEEPPTARAGWVEVDMAANAGQGAVLGETTWYVTGVSAKLTATTDLAEEGYWVLVHGEAGDAFQAFHLGAQGLDPLPVISHAGTSFLPETPTWRNVDRYGQMVFSFQGDRLAVVKNDTSVDTSKVELFNFDRGTGAVEHWADLSLQDYFRQAETPMQSMKSMLMEVDFDRTGRFMYTVNQNGTNTPTIFQYDLHAHPDSLAYHHHRIGDPGNQSMTYYDRLGALMAATPEGYDRSFGPVLSAQYGSLLIRQKADLSNYAELPLTWTYTEFLLPRGAGVFPHEVWNDHGYYTGQWQNTRLPGGLPSPCKRYTDDPLMGTAIPEVVPPKAVGVLPNPMADQAVLLFTGPGGGLWQADQVVWRDVLGREVQRSGVKQNGPSIVLERKDLPVGLYYVEVLAKDHRLGAVKVVCE